MVKKVATSSNNSSFVTASGVGGVAESSMDHSSEELPTPVVAATELPTAAPKDDQEENPDAIPAPPKVPAHRHRNNRRTSSDPVEIVSPRRRPHVSFQNKSNKNSKTKSMVSFMEQVRRQSNLDGSDDDDDDHESHMPPRPPIRPPNANNNNNNDPANNNNNNDNTIAVSMTMEDIEICQKLDDEYERALEEREIGYNARYGSVRQSAFLSVFFMVAYLSLGTAFFMQQADWTLPNSLLFSIYTITTVGYGNHLIPSTPGFQAYTIFYILMGIASLTIMVRRCYIVVTSLHQEETVRYCSCVCCVFSLF